ncbi:uncharacterized protein [Battus philenor]|uniref:uncharacterized protein isoform X3 n=1 Tax=Battus philenor TaxID=42288 RepID=UPI0035D055ED
MGNNMMHSIVLLSAFFVQLSWSYGSPNTAGVGVFVYEDSAGHRFRRLASPFPPLRPLSPLRQLRPLSSLLPSSSPFRTLRRLRPLSSLSSMKRMRYSGPGNRASFNMPGSNFAFASGAVGPGYRHQVAAINPMNPANPNVDVSRQTDGNRDGLNNRFYSVSSSSYASSVNDNGQSQNERGAETIVNDNGKVTRYSVHN